MNSFIGYLFHHVVCLIAILGPKNTLFLQSPLADACGENFCVAQDANNITNIICMIKILVFIVYIVSV